MRENKEKQALSDLMIKPVQRIPRYELLVKVTTGLAGQGGPGGGGGGVCLFSDSRQERKSSLMPIPWSLMLQQSVQYLRAAKQVSIPAPGPSEAHTGRPSRPPTAARCSAQHQAGG